MAVLAHDLKSFEVDGVVKDPTSAALIRGLKERLHALIQRMKENPVTA